MGRQWIPKLEREELLAEFDRSGMSGAKFAKKHGIRYSTWANWTRKRRGVEKLVKAETGKKAPVGQEIRWLEAKMETPSLLQSSLVVHGPNGIRFEIQDEAQAKLAGVVLKQLNGLC